jgi:hypothetical protein
MRSADFKMIMKLNAIVAEIFRAPQRGQRLRICARGTWANATPVRRTKRGRRLPTAAPAIVTVSAAQYGPYSLDTSRGSVAYSVQQTLDQSLGGIACLSGPGNSFCRQRDAVVAAAQT